MSYATPTGQLATTLALKAQGLERSCELLDQERPSGILGAIYHGALKLRHRVESESLRGALDAAEARYAFLEEFEQHAQKHYAHTQRRITQQHERIGVLNKDHDTLTDDTALTMQHNKLYFEQHQLGELLDQRREQRRECEAFAERKKTLEHAIGYASGVLRKAGIEYMSSLEGVRAMT